MNTYKISMKTNNLFSLPVAIALKQLDYSPVIIDHYDSVEGQIVVLEIKCTWRQRIMLDVGLDDYILGHIKRHRSKAENDFYEMFVRWWM